MDDADQRVDEAGLPSASMKHRIAAMDWSTSPLGPREQWPAALTTAVAICLNSHLPMFVWWGPDLINLYNDAYASVLGQRHPESLGRSAKDVWADIWPDIGEDVQRVVRDGQAIIKERVRFVMLRNGYPEETFFTYSHSPILDAQGNICGLFQVCIDETHRVVAEAQRDKLAVEREGLLRSIESERSNLASIVATAPAFICVLRGPNHRFELLNQRYSDLIGGRDVKGKTVREALPEVESQGYLDLLDKVYRTGQTHSANEAEVLLESAAGGPLVRHIVNFVYQALRDAEGNVSGIFVHGLDVTDIANSRVELGQREAQFRQIANAMPQIVWGARANGELDYYNHQWFEYIHLPPGQLNGATWSEHVHPDDLPRVAAAWGQAVRSGENYNIEFRVRSGRGQYRWFLVRAHPVRDDAGVIVRWYGTCTDIEDRKRLEARDRFLVELDDAVRPLVEPQEITATYARLLGQHLHVNRCAYADVEADEDTFNLTGDYNDGVQSIVGRYRFLQFGQQVLDLMRAGNAYVVDDVDTHQPAIRDLASYRATAIQAVICVPLLKRGRFVAAMAVHSKTPRHWHEQEVDLVLHVAARCWESIERARVVREREQLLESEQAARAEAERAGRMKDEFLATLSHELRTPLNAILGWSHIMQRKIQSDPDVVRGLEVIERNARAQSQIIEDLLDMSRIISGKVRLDVQRVDLAGIVHAAIETARPTAEAKGVRLLAVVDPLYNVVVSGDMNRLQQVMWNLLSNAIKFTPRGGQVQVLLERVNSHLEISVIDTGEGIKPEFLPYVFDRFRQADASTTRRYGGLGLGLSIVKQLVELHGGSVRVESAGPGEGSTFIVVLPLTVLQAGDGRPRRHPQAPSNPGSLPDACIELTGLRVLVVDDEPDARSLVRRFLEDCEATVTTAATAEEAVHLVQTGAYDVLVSDIGMPETDGYELIRQIRALDPAQGGSIPAIALTAYARAEDRVKVVAAGFQMHVAKPVEPVELVTMVAGAARRTGRG